MQTLPSRRGPGSPEWDYRTDVTARAMRLIGEGVVDRDGAAALAGRLGYSLRQLERLLTAEVGAGPAALARAQRAQTARTLIEGTDLPMGQVAFAAGFTSIRAFNRVVAEVYASSPTELRRRAAGRRAAPKAASSPCAWPTGNRSRPRTCSATWPPRPHPASKSGAPAPTGAPCGCRTDRASPRCAQRPATSNAACAWPTYAT
ncbi:hypothetical protein GCM10029992_44390 [Glycomyces albus]